MASSAAAQGAAQLGVRLGGGGEFVGALGGGGGGGPQQRLGLLGAVRHEVLGQLGVRLARRGRQPFRVAAQPPQGLAGGGGAGLQQVHDGLGAGGGGLPRRRVGAVGPGEQGGGARTDLVAEPVQLRQRGGLLALGPRLLGAQIGSDADLLVDLGGGPVRLPQRGQRGAGRVRGGSLGEPGPAPGAALGAMGGVGVGAAVRRRGLRLLERPG